MIDRPACPIEPWCRRETELDFNLLIAERSLRVPALPYREAGYGYPDTDPRPARR